MRRILLPKIPLLIFFAFVSMATLARGQAKPVVEVTVSKCWTFPVGETGSAIAVDASHVYLGSEDSRVEVLSLAGKKLWSSELGGEISSNLLATDNGLLLATNRSSETAEKNSGVLRSLSTETGITNWIVKLPDAERHFLAASNGTAIVVSQSGTIQAIETKTGTVKWKRDIADGFAADPAFTSDKVIVAAKANQVFTVSLVTGEIESMRKSVYRVTALGSIPNGELVVGDERGNVSILNGTDKPLWRFKSGGEISKIFTTGANILATSHDNFVYSLLARNGDVDWKKRLGGRVMQLANVGDKYVVTMSFEENTAVFTDLATGKVAGQVVFAETEKLVSPPISIGDSIQMLTDRAAYSYSLGTCGEVGVAAKY